jgi:hypothetical protein
MLEKLREYPDNYINKNFYGLTIPIMAPDSMFVHKLCAFTDRKKLQNRDLFDAHLMFTKQFDIHEEIIKIRTGKTQNEYFAYFSDFIEKKSQPTHHFRRIGELINEEQKDRIKATRLTV